MTGLTFVSNAELDAQAAQREADASPPAPPPKHIGELAAHIRRCFEAAEKYRAQSIDARLLACQRARKGEYSANELAALSGLSGKNPVYANIADTKCNAADAWIDEVMRAPRDVPYSLDPTPQPDLPEDVRESIRQEVLARFQTAMQTGTAVSMNDVREAALALYDERERAMDEEAQEIAARATETVKDQMAEGDWDKAFAEFRHNLTTYPLAILKGPVIRKIKRQKWENGEPVVVTQQVPKWEAPSPHDFYPAPNSRAVNDSYVCEVVHISGAELSKQRGQEGWNSDELDAVLSEGPAPGKGPTQTVEGGRAALEDRDTSVNEGSAPDTYKGIEFWGEVQSKLLVEWGMVVEDPNTYVAITALLINDHVVHAILNPDPLGETPYLVTSFKKLPGTIWGKAIPEEMSDCQDAVNKCWRAAFVNIAQAAGPQFSVDFESLSGETDITKVYVNKVWQWSGSKSTTGRPPVEVFNIPLIADRLQAIAEYFESKADDRTLIPRYAHGNEDIGGAGQTASGMSMLMGAAARGISRVIGDIDRDVIRPGISHLYRWDLEYLPDEERNAIKGDLRVIPRGVLSAIVREETRKRRQEFLSATNNPTDLAIIGARGRAALLRSLASDLDLPTEELVPTDEELVAQMQKQQQAAQEQAQQQSVAVGAPETAETASQSTRPRVAQGSAGVQAS